jgi:catechol 2,3-dioxygenase-like lactoylglutathione lyase family enzyme
MPMEFRRGRMIDHVQLVVRDLQTSRRFYQAVLNVLGIPISGDGDGYFFVDELFVSTGEPLTGRVHIAFQAADQDIVKRFHEVGLQAGGRDNGKPGPRDYHPGYYAAFLLDPDGNNVEAVYHGPMEKSADAIVIRPIMPPGAGS